MQGVKCYIKCRCILPQLREKKNPPTHQFEIFVTLDDGDNCIEKYVQCNNCGIIHKVVDVCKSQIIQGKEHMNSIVSVDDIKLGLDARLISILETNNAELPTYEQVQFVIENQQWGTHVVLNRDREGFVEHLKLLKIMGLATFKIVNESIDYSTGDEK